MEPASLQMNEIFKCGKAIFECGISVGVFVGGLGLAIMFLGTIVHYVRSL